VYSASNDMHTKCPQFRMPCALFVSASIRNGCSVVNLVKKGLSRAVWPPTPPYCRSSKKWRVQACQRGAFVRLIGPNVNPPVWDCPAFGATTIEGGGGHGLRLKCVCICTLREGFMFSSDLTVLHEHHQMNMRKGFVHHRCG